MVDDGKIAGILDWENSGFFPEYVEYARAADIYDYYGEISMTTMVKNGGSQF